MCTWHQVWWAENNEKVLLLEPAVTELVDLCWFIGGYQLLVGKCVLPRNLNPNGGGSMLVRNTVVH
jgi:hypothetical protein